MLTRKKAEKKALDDSLISLEDCLINDASNKLVKKYKRFLDQIDTLVNLVFGLELKIANLSISGKSAEDAFLWKNRLEEAIQIKVEHDGSFTNILTYFDTRNQLLFQDALHSKQKAICELRLLNQELHSLEMQLRVLFM